MKTATQQTSATAVTTIPAPALTQISKKGHNTVALTQTIGRVNALIALNAGREHPFLLFCVTSHEEHSEVLRGLSTFEGQVVAHTFRELEERRAWWERARDRAVLLENGFPTASRLHMMAVRNNVQAYGGREMHYVPIRKGQDGRRRAAWRLFENAAV